MRISDDRYSRDRSRLDVALHFIQHEARTHTIRAWTGLSDDRIRKLYRSYLAEPHGRGVVRHRGKSPQQPGFFLRNARLRQHSALFASLCQLMGVLPEAGDARRSLAGVGRGELLCQAYEAYRELAAEPLLSFEHAVFLVTALGRAEELSLDSCTGCGALLVLDPLSVCAPRCAHCGDADFGGGPATDTSAC